jgi:CHAT domain-containing protein
MLAGAQATPDAFKENLRGASLVHYAGHAVFNDERPDRSFFVLAGREPTGGARLSAAALSELDFRGIRLVVLSACQTIRSSTGRTGGFAGLAGSMLMAGAGGVMGSLWRVDDARTRALMLTFYEAYDSSANPSAALRTAQLKLLQSHDPALRSPSAWAGFRYTGL